MSQLLNPERGPFTDVVILDWQDFIRIGTGGTLQIASLPIGGSLALACAINTVDIAGSSSLVLNVGTTLADPDEFIDAWDVDAATVNSPVFNTGDLMVQSAGTTTVIGGYIPIKPVTAVTPIYVKVTDAAVASLTAGEVMIALTIVDPLKYRVF